MVSWLLSILNMPLTISAINDLHWIVVLWISCRLTNMHWFCCLLSYCNSFFASLLALGVVVNSPALASQFSAIFVSSGGGFLRNCFHDCAVNFGLLLHSFVLAIVATVLGANVSACLQYRSPRWWLSASLLAATSLQDEHTWYAYSILFNHLTQAQVHYITSDQD